MGMSTLRPVPSHLTNHRYVVILSLRKVMHTPWLGYLCLGTFTSTPESRRTEQSIPLVGLQPHGRLWTGQGELALLFTRNPDPELRIAAL